MRVSSSGCDMQHLTWMHLDERVWLLKKPASASAV